MSAEEIRAKVLEIVQDACPKGEVVGDGDLFGIDLGLDYLDLMEVVMNVEEALQVFIDDEEVEAIKTVGDLVKVAQEAHGPVDVIEGLLDSKDESERERR